MSVSQTASNSVPGHVPYTPSLNSEVSLALWKTILVRIRRTLYLPLNYRAHTGSVENASTTRGFQETLSAVALNASTTTDVSSGLTTAF